jgi:hypothetical protein
MTTTDEHFERVVLPALREYVIAEAHLTTSIKTGIATGIDAARDEVMRRARTTAIELHQLADHAANVSNTCGSVDQVRASVQGHCVFLRGSTPVADIELLRDVAEAFKHHTLDRKTATVTGAEAMIAPATGYSVLYYGEGKYGGAEQAVVTRKDGTQRALSYVLQNATDG